MCVSSTGCSPAASIRSTGDALVFDFTTVIDIGDGWVFPH